MVAVGTLGTGIGLWLLAILSILGHRMRYVFYSDHHDLIVRSHEALWGTLGFKPLLLPQAHTQTAMAKVPRAMVVLISLGCGYFSDANLGRDEEGFRRACAELGGALAVTAASGTQVVMIEQTGCLLKPACASAWRRYRGVLKTHGATFQWSITRVCASQHRAVVRVYRDRIFIIGRLKSTIGGSGRGVISADVRGSA